MSSSLTRVTMNRIVPVAIAAIYDRTSKKLLLAQRREIAPDDREYGYCWNLPGGGIQFSEDPITALRREVREELGVEIEVHSLLPKVFSPVRHRWHGILICYLCTLKDPSQRIILNHESSQYAWFSLEEIKKLHTLPFASDIAKLAFLASNKL